MSTDHSDEDQGTGLPDRTRAARRQRTGEWAEKTTGDYLPTLPPKPADGVIAVLVADLHISLKPPLARSVEPDWLAAQARQLKELKDLAEQHNASILCAGDVFDRAVCTPELVNWTIKNLPVMYSVCGQHDLVHHRLDDLHKTAYQTLVETHNIWNVPPGKPVECGKFRIWGFPWGVPLEDLPNPQGLGLEIALCHFYAWVPGKSYPDAPTEGRLKNWSKKIHGYDVVVTGDNHLPWTAKIDTTTVFNPGGFYRRNRDQIDHKPSVGLLHADGSVTRHFLDCSQDKFLEEAGAEDRKDSFLDASGFLDELNNLSDAVVDFEDAMKRCLEQKKISRAVREITLAALDGDPKVLEETIHRVWQRARRKFLREQKSGG